MVEKSEGSSATSGTLCDLMSQQRRPLLEVRPPTLSSLTSLTSYLCGRNLGITHFLFSSFMALGSFLGDRRALSPGLKVSHERSEVSSRSTPGELLGLGATH